ncbi:MAG: FAD:protein FMN transferase, partial [Bacillota bacterium]
MNPGSDFADRHNQKIQAPRKRKVLGPVLFVAGLLIIVGAAIDMISGGGSPAKMHHYYHTAMDTAIELQFNAAGLAQAEAVKSDLFAEVDRLERLLSRSASGSDVDRVNAKAGVSPVSVDDETLTVAEAALKYAGLSEGAFDPTIAPFLDQWGFLGQQFRVPSPAQIEALFPLVDYTLLEIDRARGTIYLPAAGMSLDLGGIAKGYIVDRGLAVLARAG